MVLKHEPPTAMLHEQECLLSPALFWALSKFQHNCRQSTGNPDHGAAMLRCLRTRVPLLGRLSTPGRRTSFPLWQWKNLVILGQELGFKTDAGRQLRTFLLPVYYTLLHLHTNTAPNTLRHLYAALTAGLQRVLRTRRAASLEEEPALTINETAWWQNLTMLRQKVIL